LLFKNLDDEQMHDVLDAMTEKKVPKENVTVIHQGDVGDFFYVVEEGGFDFYIKKAGIQGLGDKVGSVGSGGSFGELALMYNAPRAASVVSSSPGILWALDRITFRRILMDVSRPKQLLHTLPQTLFYLLQLGANMSSTPPANGKCTKTSSQQFLSSPA
jgi:cAMP-dependent protein kinase regulator